MADGSGWFADPSGKINTFRWWDGQGWTRWLSADAAAPDPGPVPRRAAHHQTTVAAEPPPSAEATLAEPTDPQPRPQSFAPPDPADRVVGLPAAAAIIVAGVLLAVIAVGAIISLTADRPLTGPAVAPPPPVDAPLLLTYDAATRTVSAEELRAVLPADPFLCDDRPREVPGLFTWALSCNVVVHADYDDKLDWSATSGVGILDEKVGSVDELREMAAQTASGLITRNYTVEDVTIKKAKNVPLGEVAPDGKARIVTAELHVPYRDLPSAYDRMSVAVFELESGEHVAYWSLEPEKSPRAVAGALDESAATVTARK